MDLTSVLLFDLIDSSSEDDSDAGFDLRVALSARTRSIWIQRHIEKKKERGEFNLYNELSLRKFEQYFRISKLTFTELHELIEADIKKLNTTMRKSISSEERLAVCLRYLSTGDSFRTIAFSYRIGESTVSSIVEEVCDALWRRLQPKVLTVPTKEDWKCIASAFKEICQFDHACGALDGKHVVIRAPPNSGSDYFNYKHTFSIVLLAVADAKRKFTIIDLGSKGRFSDGGIFADSEFGRRMRTGELDLPDEEPLIPGGVNMPFVFLGDEAFPLMPNLMRAYPRDHLTENRKIYNYRLCRARRVVENAFGILAARWRVYKRPFECRIELVDKIVKATCVLHNYCIDYTNDYFNIVQDQHVIFDDTNSQLRSLPQNQNTYYANDSFFIREEFCRFFNTDGAVPWQSTRIKNKLNNNN